MSNKLLNKIHKISIRAVVVKCRIESLIIVECQTITIESMIMAIAQKQSRRRLLGDYVRIMRFECNEGNESFTGF